MSKKDDGGPAFPSGFVQGMTLRDWFAGQAMQALIAKHKAFSNNGQYAERVDNEDLFRESLVAGAYAYADAMIKEGKND